MAIERRGQSTINQADNDRLESMRKRLISDEWADSHMSGLTLAIAHFQRLVNVSKTTNLSAIEQQIRYILSICDTLSTAAQVATKAVDVIHVEKDDCLHKTNQLKEQIEAQQSQIDMLTQELKKEKLHQQRIENYDALARIILKEPSCEQSKMVLQEKSEMSRNIEEEIDSITSIKQNMAKQISLLLQCSNSLWNESNQMVNIIKAEDAEQMDISG